MTLRMADGPVANLPAGLDAYAGYTDNSGIGVTYPAVIARFPKAWLLSISVHGQAFARCGDVETGALSTWRGYDVGYCSLNNVGNQIRNAGRPKKLWVAHYTNTAHICTQTLCDPSLKLTALAGWVADGTQWTDHGGAWDESLLADDFFSFLTPSNPPPKGPVHVPSSAITESIVSVSSAWNPASNGGQLDVFMVGQDGAVYHKYWIASGPFAGWNGPDVLTGAI